MSANAVQTYQEPAVHRGSQTALQEEIQAFRTWFLRGVKQDFRARLPYYADDWTAGWGARCLAFALYLTYRALILLTSHNLRIGCQPFRPVASD